MSVLQNGVGWCMRLYRKSPLWPHAGTLLAKLLARLPRSGGMVRKSVGGLIYELDLGQVIDASIYYSGTFEKNVEDLIDRLTGPGMTVLDIGANVGYHTVRLARNVGAEGKVAAFEPTSGACERLRRNLELNGFQNTTVHQLALSDRDEGVQLRSFQSSYPLHGDPTPVEEQIRIASLDQVAAETGLSGIRFIKLDVDGFEEKVLLGALDTLRRDFPALLLEVTPPPEEGQASRPLEILEELGYSFYDEQRRAVLSASTSHDWRKGESAINLVTLPPGRTL